ncbi:MAG: LysR family transcriptional regulator, partial [Sphingomonadaceae bacterium]|nr:LysR family transcriptional regulator [Sphingomonadaceae bacterium]
MEISFRQISYFLRLVESGSFTRAAGALGITQPALSIAVSQLEKALGAQLIERGISPITLTESGITFLRYATRVQRSLQEARDEISALNSGTLGRLDICMGPSAAGPEVGAVLTSMTEEFPNVEIHVQSGVMPAVAERLRNGEFSLYVGTVSDEFSDPTLEVTHLSTISLGMVAGATHPLARKAEVLPSDLLAYPWIAIGNIDANLP